MNGNNDNPRLTVSEYSQNGQRGYHDYKHGTQLTKRLDSPQVDYSESNYGSDDSGTLRVIGTSYIVWIPSQYNNGRWIPQSITQAIVTDIAARFGGCISLKALGYDGTQPEQGIVILVQVPDTESTRLYFAALKARIEKDCNQREGYTVPIVTLG